MSQEQFLRIALIQDMRAFLTHAREDMHVHARLFLQLNQITILLSCIFVLSSSIHLLNRCVVLRVVSCLGQSLAVAFLTTRVKGPDIDDWRKLRHVIEYLRVTRDLPLILGADGSGVLSWYVDASFAVHPDMRGHTGGAMTMGRGYPLDTSTKHRVKLQLSTI